MHLVGWLQDEAIWGIVAYLLPDPTQQYTSKMPRYVTVVLLLHRNPWKFRGLVAISQRQFRG